MKYLIRRLSKVADSSSEFFIRRSTFPFRNRRGHHRLHQASPPLKRVKTVPAGHVPVYVGEEMERFVVSAEIMNHPVFVRLLNQSAQEYGYAQKRVLHIPCHVIVFERVVETLRVGGFDESGEINDLVTSLFLDYDELKLATTE